MFPHGIMFHHFTDQVHARGQGAISAEEFEGLLQFVGIGRILSAPEWLRRLEANRLEAHHLCLTFDDGLRCQVDVALPVLNRYGIQAFWFPYTGPLAGDPDRLEIYRYFRTVQFEDIDQFYQEFDDVWEKSSCASWARTCLRSFDPTCYLSGSPYYTIADRRFRFLRDQVFGPRVYLQLMEQMMESHGFVPEKHYARLWMSPDDLRDLHAQGHVLGLHTHTHPTNVRAHSLRTQAHEYCVCSRWLRQLTGVTPQVAAHPCNSYNTTTLHIMRELGVRLSFRADMQQQTLERLEWPREDHSNVRQHMRAHNEAILQQSRDGSA